MPDVTARTRRVPPRWCIELAWTVHRVLFRVTGGRRGLWLARAECGGPLRLTSIGRRSGDEIDASLSGPIIAEKNSGVAHGVPFDARMMPMGDGTHMVPFTAAV